MQEKMQENSLYQPKLDCKFFLGEKPCIWKKVCWDCNSYEPMGVRILIIKLGALGDVLRTTTLLSGLKRKYPCSCITWLTDKNSQTLLENNSLIDRIAVYSCSEKNRLMAEDFDLLINLEKEPRALALATLIKSKKILGFKMSSYGTLEAANPETEYMLRLGIDDELKFKINQKTYQEVIYEACDLEYDRYVDLYIFKSTPEEQEWARKKLLSAGWNDNKKPLIGLNTGSGTIWTTKRWTIEGFAKLASFLEHEGCQVVLLGGEDELKRNLKIKKFSSAAFVDVGCDNSLRQFAAIVGMLDILVSGDTIAMHLGIAQETPVVAIFGATTPQEIDLYNKGKKIITNVNCAPCYKADCDNIICMKEISPEYIMQEITKLIKVKELAI